MSKRKYLPLDQKVKLMGWMKENIESFTFKSIAKVAAMAREALGFELTEWHVQHVRDSFGLKWKSKNGKGAEKAAVSPEVQALAKFCAHMHVQAHGYPLPQYLNDIANGVPLGKQASMELE